MTLGIQHAVNVDVAFKGELLTLAEQTLRRQVQRKRSSANKHIHSYATYMVTGPPSEFVGLKPAVRELAERFGSIVSPLAEVDLPEAPSELAGVPTGAAFYAYLYPVHQAAQTMEGELLRIDQPWASLMLFGGFAYFNDARQLLAVNVFASPTSEKRMHFSGPHKVVGPAVVEVLQREARFRPVTAEDLCALGFESFTWVHGRRGSHNTYAFAHVHASIHALAERWSCIVCGAGACERAARQPHSERRRQEPSRGLLVPPLGPRGHLLHAAES